MRLKKRYFLLVFLLLIIALGVESCRERALPEALMEQASLQFQTYKKQGAFASAPRYWVLIDLSQPLYERRLWLWDTQEEKVVMNVHTSHAWNSGFLWASEFSNVSGSSTSCYGGFRTGAEYVSSFQFEGSKAGMRIHGLDKGVNDAAYGRNIVFHPHYWPWSEGCYMTLPEVNEVLIDYIKDGNYVYVWPGEMEG